MKSYEKYWCIIDLWKKHWYKPTRWQAIDNRFMEETLVQAYKMASYRQHTNGGQKGYNIHG